MPTGYADAAGMRMELTPVDAATIALDPYPFDRPSLTASVIYRRLNRTTFQDDKDLQAAYFGAAPQVAPFTFVRSS